MLSADLLLYLRRKEKMKSRDQIAHNHPKKEGAKMKLNVKAFSLTCGIVWGFGLFLLTWWIIAFEGATGEPTLIGLLYGASPYLQLAVSSDLSGRLVMVWSGGQFSLGSTI